MLQDGVLVERDLLVEDGRITAVGDEVPHQAQEIVDARGRWIVPGLVNAHSHSYGQLCRDAIADDRLEAWIAGAVASAAGLSAEAAGIAAQLNALDGLRHGATTSLDHATLGEGHVQALVTAYSLTSVRVALAAQVGDVAFADSLLGLSAASRDAIRAADPRRAPRWEEQLDACRALVAAVRGHDRIAVLLGPSAPERCSPALLDGVAAIAAAEQLGFHVHLLETNQQRAGGDPLGILENHGLLRPGLSLAHAVHLDDHDLQRIAEAKAAIVHNPMSNLSLGSGRLDLRRVLDAGVTVGLGCDGWTTGGAQDVLAQARLALVGRRPDTEPATWLAPEEVWALAGPGGAAALGLDPLLGTLAPGAPADLLLVDPARAGFVDGVDPVAQLVLGGLSAGLVEAWVSGRCVLRDGDHEDLDAERLLARAAELLPELRRAAAPYAAVARRLSHLVASSAPSVPATS